MTLGDEFNSKTVNAYQLADFADSCNLSRKLIATRLKHICTKLITELENDSFSRIAQTKNEQDFTKRLLNSILLKAKHLLLESEGVTQIEIHD